MDRELSKKQRDELISFLKRWGIDHSVLLAEMVDHYTEKALDEIQSGNSWDQILAGWKTKKTFRTLREIDTKFTEQYNRQWRQNQWITARSLLTDRLTGIIVLAVCLLFWIAASWDISSFLGILVILKFILAYAIMIYAKVHKRYRAILTYKDFGIYAGFYAALVIVCRDHALAFFNQFAGAQVPVELSIVFLGISFLVDIFAFKLYKSSLIEAQHLSDDMLRVHIPQPFQNKTL